MVRRFCTVFALLLVLRPGSGECDRGQGLEGIELGGRFEYMMLLDEQANPYPWNVSTRSATDRTRLMLDLNAPGTRYGSLYLKGAAFWGLVGKDDVQKRFRFAQGDYLWEQRLESWKYALRLFANERRFFVYDFAAPLLDDDHAGETGENRGVRFDTAVRDRLDITGLYSLLGTDPHASRSVAYLKALYSSRLFGISTSYMFDDPGNLGLRNHAVVKAELTTSYRRFFGAFSYQQSGYKDSGWFLPGGSFDWGAWDGTNFSRVLPSGGAAFAELRLSSVQAADLGKVNLVWRDEAVGDEFVNDLGLRGASRVGTTAGAYFVADDVSLNARLLYYTGARSGLEREQRDLLEGNVWTALNGGLDCFLRGGIGKIEDESVYDTKKNFIHAALRYRVKKMRTGAHIMWSDLDTIYSQRRFAWDGKLALSPDWGFQWRVLLTRDFQIGQTAVLRLEYRPNDRIFAYVGYGMPYFGDDPFVLEDRDIGLLRQGTSQYIISLRGDF